MEGPADPILNGTEFGRRAKAARVLAGCDSVKEAVDLIQSESGVHIHPRTLYAIERGEQTPTIEQFMAILIGYKPPAYGDFFVPAFREDVQRAIRPERRRSGDD